MQTTSTGISSKWMVDDLNPILRSVSSNAAQHAKYLRELQGWRELYTCCNNCLEFMRLVVLQHWQRRYKGGWSNFQRSVLLVSSLLVLLIYSWQGYSLLSRICCTTVSGWSGSGLHYIGGILNGLLTSGSTMSGSIYNTRVWDNWFWVTYIALPHYICASTSSTPSSSSVFSNWRILMSLYTSSKGREDKFWSPKQYSVASSSTSDVVGDASLKGFYMI